MNVGETKIVHVMNKDWTIRMLAAGEEIGSNRPTYKVIHGPIEIAGYWYRESAVKKNIKRRYKAYLEEQKKKEAEAEAETE